MLSILIFFLIICSASFWVAVRFGRSFEESMPSFVAGMIFISFVCGILGFLQVGIIACVVIAVIMYCLGIWELIFIRKFGSFLKCMLTPGFVVFAIAFFALAYFNVGRMASSWDEFSHWVDIVKAMVYVDDFGTNPAANSAFQSYPPGMSVFQYMLQKIYLFINPDNGFNEWRVFFSCQILCLIPMFPFFRGQSFKKPINLILCTTAVFATPLIFYPMFYCDVRIDPFLSILAGSALAMILLWKDKGKLYSVTIWSYCALLVLAKDAGMMFAVFVLIAYCADVLVRCDKKPFFSGNWKKLLDIPFAAASVALPKLLWSIELSTSNAEIRFSQRVDIKTLAKVILGRDDSYRTTSAKNFVNALFDRGVEIGHSGITVNYFTLLVVFFLGIYCIYCLYAVKKEKGQLSAGITLALVAVQTVVYIIGVSVSYLFKFSEYEAVNLASFQRYMNVAFCCVWLVLIFAFIHIADKVVNSRAFKAILLSIMLILTPLKGFFQLTSGEYVAQSENFRASYQPLRELIDTYCDGNDSIYFISQDSDGYDYWVSRFNARPNSFSPSFTWSVGESEYQGGMYARDITPEEWLDEILENYDYVAVYRINTTFYKDFRIAFENSEHIGNNALYKVDRERGLLVRCSASE